MPTTSQPTIDDAVTAMKDQRWWLALHRFSRVRALMKVHTPPAVYALGSTCLHRLGRYEEAEAWAHEGLGPQQRALLAIDPVFTEAELLSRWSGVSTPVVSIMCMAYNHERYIESTLRGFLNQNTTYPFEIIIHDDASTDNTQAIIRRWQAQYPTIIRTILQPTNILSKGGNPYNLMLAAARGAYIATCEGDDFWRDASKLQRQVSFLEANPDYVCSGHNYYHYVESALTVKPFYPVLGEQTLTQRDLMGISRLLWVPTIVYRKLFNELPAETHHTANGDMILTSFLGTFGKGMYFENHLSAVRRENPYSVWTPLSENTKWRNRVKSWMLIVRMHLRLGNEQAVEDLLAHVARAPLDEAEKAQLVEETLHLMPANAAAA